MSDQDKDQPVTKDGQLLRAKLSLSTNAQRAINILSTQAATTFAVAGSIASNLNEDSHPSSDIIAAEDREIGSCVGLGVSIIASIVWYVTDNSTLEAYQAVKKLGNPIYRSFETAAFVGNAVGDALSYAFFFLPEWMRLPLNVALSTGLGVIFGVIGAIFFRDTADSEPSVLFRVGKDGWTRYGKPGLQLGANFGRLVGAFLPIPFGMAIGSALGSVIGFITFITIVPLINVIKSYFFPAPNTTTLLALTPQLLDKQGADALTASSEDPNLRPHIYRTNYIRLGATVGVGIGAIIAFMVPLFIVPPLGAIIFGLVCAAVGSALGAATIGIWDIIYQKPLIHVAIKIIVAGTLVLAQVFHLETKMD